MLCDGSDSASRSSGRRPPPAAVFRLGVVACSGVAGARRRRRRGRRRLSASLRLIAIASCTLSSSDAAVAGDMSGWQHARRLNRLERRARPGTVARRRARLRRRRLRRGRAAKRLGRLEPRHRAAARARAPSDRPGRGERERSRAHRELGRRHLLHLGSLSDLDLLLEERAEPLLAVALLAVALGALLALGERSREARPRRVLLVVLVLVIGAAVAALVLGRAAPRAPLVRLLRDHADRHDAVRLRALADAEREEVTRRATLC